MLQRIILLLLFSPCVDCYSQELTGKSFYELQAPEEPGEKIVLETDRQFYCVNENIYFTAAYLFDYQADDIQWSEVMYVELIKWNGEKITQAKFKINNDHVSGYLVIPGTLLSGNYYLRAYTKWMRNYPPGVYAYKRVKILNPFETDFDTGPAVESGDGFQLTVNEVGKSIQGIECMTNKSTYGRREEITLTILLNGQYQVDSDFCISVAKGIALQPEPLQIMQYSLSGVSTLDYLPETRGISVSGKVNPSHTPDSPGNALVHLSSLKHHQYFSVFQTNESGHFYFTLPDLSGQNEFYIDAILTNGGNTDILVDNDYCNRNIQLPYVSFSLDTLEKNTALEMMVNMQLTMVFDEQDSASVPESRALPFYGIPNHVYDTRDYIELPNLEEFLFELVPEVRAIRMKKQVSLKLIAYHQYNDLPPLVLLDNLPVYLIDELLNIPLERIERVEVLDEPYLLSGKMYSGVISIVSKSKDFGGLQYPGNSRFFTYNLFSEGEFTVPDYNSEQTDRNIYRQNLLYWDPDLVLHPDQPENISFYTSDSKGEYTVYIRSVSPGDQPPLYGSCKIVVD